ncbi:MAG: NAD-dependent epimerase/dehydratase family protein [Desulfamplus sp.]|nr:NAD-dependent epimerase/dehydratase family protein [Desulfamplus sp.]
MEGKLKKRALVTGASGKIGTLLVTELLRQNFKVRVLLRKQSLYPSNEFIFSSRSCSSNTFSYPSPVFLVSPDVEIVWGDITDYHSVLDATSGVDYIFHLAALLHINNPDPSLYGKYYDINVIGTRNVFDAALKSGVQRVILFSTISVYGSSSINSLNSDRAIYSSNQVVNNIFPNKDIFYESSPVNPLSIYSKTKVLAERYQSSFVTILRLASVYGTRVTGNYLRLIEAVKRGFFIIPVNKEGFSVYRTLIHENDVVLGAILAATHPEAAGKIYNLTDGDIHSLEDIVKAVADAFSVNVRILRIPAKPIHKFSNVIRRYNRINISPISRNIEKALSAVDKLMENIAVDGHKIQIELGFKPQYDLQSGWYHALADKKAVSYK